MSKPVLLIDCDGVLADFTALALDMIEEETGNRHTADEIKRWDIFTSLGYPELWPIFNARASQPGLCRGMKAYPNAAKAMKKIAGMCDVLVVTAPVDAPPWMHERARWLEEKFDIPFDMVVFAHAKQHVRGDVFVDDKPQNVAAWARMNPDGLAVLWDHPYNRDAVLPNGAIRTSSWNRLIALLETISIR